MTFEILNLTTLEKIESIKPIVMNNFILTRLIEGDEGFLEEGPITIFKDEFLGAEQYGRRDVSKITLKIRKRFFKIIVDGNAADLEKMFQKRGV